jgi:hypothetical protein
MTYFFVAVSKDATIKASTSIHPSHKLNKIEKQHLSKSQLAIAKKTILHSNTSADFCGGRNFVSPMWPLLFCFHYRSKARIRPNRKPQDIQHLQVI